MAKTEKKITKEILATKNEDKPKIHEYIQSIVKDHILNQIKKLQNVNLYVDGWKEIVEDKDKSQLCADFQILTLRNRATYLAMLYYMSLSTHLVP